VYGGAMRTYLPGLRPQEPFPRRHRVLSAATMRALRSRSANAVRDQVLGLSTRRTPPASYPLVRRVLARRSAERTVADRRRPAAAKSVQPTLFPSPAEPDTLPGFPQPPTLLPEGNPRLPRQGTAAPEVNRVPAPTAKLAEADEEIALLYSEIDDLTRAAGGSATSAIIFRQPTSGDWRRRLVPTSRPVAIGSASTARSARPKR
jgi:hypothetical protein